MNRKTLLFIVLGIMVVASYLLWCIALIEVPSVVSSTISVEKKVSAFYYGWYGNTTDFSQSFPYPIEDNDAWWHWDYAEWGWYPPANACSVNTPTQGWYDSSVFEPHSNTS